MPESIDQPDGSAADVNAPEPSPEAERAVKEAGYVEDANLAHHLATDAPTADALQRQEQARQALETARSEFAGARVNHEDAGVQGLRVTSDELQRAEAEDLEATLQMQTQVDASTADHAAGLPPRDTSNAPHQNFVERVRGFLSGNRG